MNNFLLMLENVICNLTVFLTEKSTVHEYG